MARALTLGAILLAACGARVPRVTDQSHDARVMVVDLGDTVRVDITSEKGIGRATLERTARWPRAMLFRLHLRGLEGLEMIAGPDTVRVSRPTAEGPPAAGWYDVAVPDSLLRGHQALTVTWVDFYR